jgi:hypothetical protein
MQGDIPGLLDPLPTDELFHEFQSSKDAGGYAGTTVLPAEPKLSLCFNHQKMWGDMSGK